MVSYQNNANAGRATSSTSHAGPINYLGSSDQKYFTIDKATLQITWSNPQAIDYGTALSSTQVNAEANVLGSFAYDPLAGMVLLSCTQTLKQPSRQPTRRTTTAPTRRSHTLSTPSHSPASYSRSTGAAFSTR